VDDVTLTKTICALLGRIDGWVWRETGPAYSASKVGVFYGAIGETPDRAVGVRLYGGTDDPIEFVSSRRVQLRVRGAVGDVASADLLASQAFSALHGLSRVDGISGISRQSLTPLGADSNRRQERTENYLIIFDNPEEI
jgi:hypothetical protein